MQGHQQRLCLNPPESSTTTSRPAQFLRKVISQVLEGRAFRLQRKLERERFRVTTVFLASTSVMATEDEMCGADASPHERGALAHATGPGGSPFCGAALQALLELQPRDPSPMAEPPHGRNFPYWCAVGAPFALLTGHTVTLRCGMSCVRCLFSFPLGAQGSPTVPSTLTNCCRSDS